MPTFLELKNRVLGNLIDAPARTEARVGDFINNAQKKLQIKHNFKVMEAELSGQITAASTRNLANRPTGFKELRDKPYLTFNLGKTKELVWAPSKRSLLRTIGTLDEGQPRAIYDNGAQFEVWPLSDGLSDFSGGEYRVSLPYWGFVADLSASGDTNWFTDNAAVWLEYQATAEAFFFNEDENRATVWTQRAAGEFAEVVTRDKRYYLSNVDTLVPGLEGYKTPLLGE